MFQGPSLNHLLFDIIIVTKLPAVTSFVVPYLSRSEVVSSKPSCTLKLFTYGFTYFLSLYQQHLSPCCPVFASSVVLCRAGVVGELSAA